MCRCIVQITEKQTVFLRSPLLWFMLPWIAGIASSQAFFFPDIVALPALSVLTISSLLLSCSKKYAIYWKVSFCSAVFLLGMCYSNLRSAIPHQLNNEIPTQSAFFVVRIDHIFNTNSNGYFSGIVSIKETPPHLSFCLEKSFYFKTRKFPKETQPIISGEISFYGKITFLTKENILTDFDDFLIKRGNIGKITYARNIKPEKTAHAFYRFFYFCSSLCEQMLRINIPSKEKPLGDIYVGMLLGNKQVLSEDQKTAFSQSGTFHLFAVSGLHVGIVALFIHSVLRVFRIRDPYRSILVIIPLFCYVGIAGFSASATRAFLMVLCYLIAANIKRQQAAFPAMISSAFLILLWKPSEIFNIGFQLSYLIVSAILLFSLPLQNRFNELASYKIHKTKMHPFFIHLLNHCSRFIITTLCISFSATLASMPLSLLYFSVFNPFAFLVNAILVTVASGVLILGILSISLSGCGIVFIGSFFNYGAILLIFLMIKCIDIFLFLVPFSPRTYTTPTVTWITVFSIFFAFFLAERNNWNIAKRVFIPSMILTFSLVLTTAA